ncbi:hypothetical protein KPL71_016340 [Citrus sinensis]|uniref:Uncharacterized protein n=1 Tax=Citrus sinensis TaxID=2711 RepID=A0ACB8KS96_CITSI|nr:hypothetical protein KPL71_016340 [Citrus sinensis]
MNASESFITVTHHHCVNAEGSYKCNCRKGYHGDGGKDGQGCNPKLFPVIKDVVLGVGIFFVVVPWVALGSIRKFSQQNGGYLLQPQLSKRSGSSDTEKIFTAGELKIATNNYAYDRMIGRGGYGTVFLGSLSDNKAIAIKKSRIVYQSQIEQCINKQRHNIYIQVKLPTISWEVRIRIAAETAEGLSFLHSAASTPIIP